VKWALTAVLVVSLGVRLSVGARQSNHFEVLPDQLEYLQIAQNLLAGKGLEFFDSRFGQTVWAFRTPGYPLFVAACGGSICVVRIAQAIVDTSTVLAIYLLARKWLSRPGAVLAAAIVGINPLLIYLSTLVLSETLCISLICWGTYLLVRGGRGWIGGMVLLALSVLVRPSGLLLPALLAGVSGGGWRAIAAAGVTLLALLPWAVRNQMVLHHWVWTTTDSGITLYDGFHPGANGASDQNFVRDMPQLQGMDEFQRNAELRRLAGQFIAQNPAEALRLAVVKIGRTWTPVPLSEQFGSKSVYVWGEACYAIPLMGLALIGLLRRGLPVSAKMLLITPAIYFTIVHAASVGSLRYRSPVEPMMAILAASASVGFRQSPGRKA